MHETGISLASRAWRRLPKRMIAVALCGSALAAGPAPADFWRWLVPSASAAGMSEQEPRTGIRVRCGILSDNHGAQVLGKGADRANVNPDAQRCPASAPPKTEEAQARPEMPVQEPPRADAETPRVKPARRVPASVQPASAAAVQAVHVAPAWINDESRRLAQFNPSTVQRVSTALMSGGVLWFLQSSFWASLLLLGLPLWRHVDLLAIVARVRDDADEQPAADDEALAGILAGKPSPQSNRVR